MTVEDQVDSPPASVRDLAVELSVVSTDPHSPPSASPRESRSWRTLPWMRILAWLGVLVPFALLTKQAILSPPSFDGSMNLQVAQNLAQGHGFTRQYITGQGGIVNLKANTTLFPQEIQTSGAYIFIAAAFIKIFGASTFVYELPNLLFMLLLLAATSIALRRWPVLRIIGPAAVVFCVPGMNASAMGGYGEYVVAALVIASFVVLGTAASGSRRPLLLVVGASVLLGLALTVKTVAFFAVPAFVLGLIGLALARPGGVNPRFKRWLLLPLPIAGLVAPLAAVEIQRLVSLGSFAKFGHYWSLQYDAAGEQAGVSGTRHSAIAADETEGLHKIADHFHLLALQTGIHSVVLLIAIVTPFLLLIGLFLYRGMAWRDWLAKPGALLSIMLASYAGLYFLWWLEVTPTAKAWLRRVVIALVVVVLLGLVLAGMAKDRYRERQVLSSKRSPRRLLIARLGWGMVAVFAVVSVIPAITTFRFEVSSTYHVNGTLRDEVIALADEAKKLSSEGNVLYAAQFLSAPQAGLYGDLSLRNLGSFAGISTPPQVAAYCQLASGIPDGKAYYVWDYYSMNLADASRRSPYSLTLNFTPIQAGSSPYGLIYKIALTPGLTGKYACPANS